MNLEKTLEAAAAIAPTIGEVIMFFRHRDGSLSPILILDALDGKLSENLSQVEAWRAAHPKPAAVPASGTNAPPKTG